LSIFDWKQEVAASWRRRTDTLRPVRHRDPVCLADLLGVEVQKAKLVRNTERFLQGQPSNHALLWGSRGTGKSSLVKALLNEYQQQGLRMIEVDRDDLADLPYIVDDIRELKYRFVIFCDDLGFDAGDSGYRHLKSVLEGSLELPPENVRLYATSNRRHLLPEYMSDNTRSTMVEGELHQSEAIEEKISLADRFGLSLSFYPLDQRQYLAIVDHLFPEESNRAALHIAANRFAMERGVRSGRTARQFYNAMSGDRPDVEVTEGWQ
jgi:uncharacterized protein